MQIRMRRYLLCYGAALLALGVAIVIFTVAVDPYRMYGTPPIIGLTEIKPRIYEQAAMAKTYQLERTTVATIVLGNSRAEIGLDPDSSQWPEDARPVFNAALAGRGLFTSVRMLQHALAIHPLKLVVIGLDFPDFLVPQSNGSSPEIGPDELRLLVDRSGGPNGERARQLWRDRFNTTLTLDAVLDSLATVIGQNPSTGITMTLAGFNPLNNYRLEVRRNGHFQLFSQKDRTYREQLTNLPKPDFTNLDHNAGFRSLKSLLRITAENDIQTILFIHPYHARYLEIIHESGLWETFEAWKRAIVCLIASEADRRSTPIQLFDFSGYSDFTTEPVPLPNDTRTQMQWYWESGHYKSTLGERMLARIFHDTVAFGRTLDETNIEEALMEMRIARAAFLKKESVTELTN